MLSKLYHPVRCSDHRLSFLMLLNIRTKPEIRYFDFSIKGQQHVIRLYVAMNDALLVKKTYRLKNLKVRWAESEFDNINWKIPR